MIILSLDISSTNIGVCIMQSHKKALILSTVIKPPKKLELFQQFDYVHKEIDNLINLYAPERVIIEKFIPFMKGKSRASTIILLAQWNTNLAYHLYQKKIPIIFQAVATTRSRLKLNKSDKISKEDIPAILLNRYNIKVDNDLGFDKSDSIAQAIAYIIKENIC